MGVYNPSAPIILGQEWVPIRNEDFVISASQQDVEVGHTFTLNQASTALGIGAFYAHGYGSNAEAFQFYMASIYPRGREALSGPIQSVIIPCNSGGVTGTTVQTDIPGKLYNPLDFESVLLDFVGTSPSSRLDMYFNTSAYLPQLLGKRILDVRLLYSAYYFNDAGIDEIAANNVWSVRTRNVNMSEQSTASDDGFLFWSTDGKASPIFSVSLGSITQLWNSTAVGYAPWTSNTLALFEPSSGVNRIAASISTSENTVSSSSANLFIAYAALQVFYCEEQRSATAIGYFGDGSYILGRNTLPTFRNIQYPHSTGVNLPAGEYTVTLSSPQAYVNNFSPPINALRQLYPISSHSGVKITLPFPLDDTSIGSTLVSEEVSILPQISVHVSGGAPLTEVHVYGRQAVAEVYGSITATQHIQDSIASSGSWPWVRFVARRFGDTTIPLNVNVAGQDTSITPDEFDALDPVVDGWKEITLRFDTPPTMGGGTIPTVTWSATGETAGNRWELLGAIAPALSGIPGNLINMVPSVQRLNVATYGQPVSGAVINMGWVPQYAPPVSATTQDQSSDAFVIFAQDLPEVSGFAVTTVSQPVSGIGQDCGLDPCGIPTDILYNEISWDSVHGGAVPASGIGYYELQRMDTVDSDWETIMQASGIGDAPSGAAPGAYTYTYNDYEARVGIETSYQIRAVDLYDFPGPWSDTLTVTIPSPGVSGGCLEGGHILIFTTNEYQDGSANLAYSSVWSGQVQEEFTFPEAADVQLQAMYNRDFFTAFHSTERGGEQFSRTILVQAAAIDPETLADFNGIRDLAWDDVSYVCVRDEDGNRWLANIRVSSGTVLLNRSLYLASVQIVEVTATPSPVDPWS